jgi:hypothetical protein
MRYDLDTRLAIINDVDAKPSSSKPLVLVRLLGPRLCAHALKLNKEQPLIWRDKEPIWCVAVMEFVCEASKRFGRFYQSALER